MLPRLMRVVQPAPPPVEQMVEKLVLEMKVSGPIQVFQLEWAQVNAVVWQRYRATGFSRPMLELMPLEEVRAIAAHELGRLLEPRWVQAVRVPHMFAYLPVVLVLRYGGALGIPLGWGLMMAVALACRRFARRILILTGRGGWATPAVETGRTAWISALPLVSRLQRGMFP